MPVKAAESNPIARILVDTGVGHLDEPYDYLVTTEQDAMAKPGVRVRVRFAGKLVDGWLLERVESSDFSGKLSNLSSVVSGEVLLTPALIQLCFEVARRQAGSPWDVVRAAVPKRHAKIETSESVKSTYEWTPGNLPDGYQRLGNFFDHISENPRAVWNVAPGRNAYQELASVVRKTAAADRGVLVVLPDERDVARLHQKLDAPDGVAVLRGDLSPAERYRRFLRIARGADRVVIGTRGASFAPVHNLGLIIVWDDGDQSHFDPHAPYWNTLDVLALRSHLEKVPFISAGFSTSVDAARLIETGWAHLIDHSVKPRVITSDEEFARVTTKTWKLIRESLQKGPVLISVPRTGYRPVLQCKKCGTAALCHCGGRIAQSQGEQPQCQICAALHEKYECAACGGSGYRSASIGIERTTEEIGKAFPKVVIKHSTGAKPIDVIPDKPMIVLSTQGVEPIAPHGYSAVVILDLFSSLYRSDLRAEEEARRRWFNTAALVRADGVVALSGDASHPAIQSLVRWSPTTAATRELAQRQELHFPPSWQLATVDAPSNSQELLDSLAEIGEVLGPIPAGEGWRVIVRAPQSIALPLRRLAVSRALKRAPVRVQINPYTL